VRPINANLQLQRHTYTKIDLHPVFNADMVVVSCLRQCAGLFKAILKKGIDLEVRCHNVLCLQSQERFK
jgi:hypothetical protein